MKSKSITLCGIQVIIGYCAATEIAYNELTDGDSIDNLFASMAPKENGSVSLPQTRNILCFIFAGIMVYAQSKNEEPAITMSNLMTEAAGNEIATAMLEMTALRNEFYYVPATIAKKDAETAKTEKGKKRKNA